MDLKQSIHSIVTFRIKPGEIEAAKVAINEFIRNIRQHEPDTLWYRSLQEMNEPTRFTHVMAFKDRASQLAHKNSAYCREFVTKLYPLCEGKPEDRDYTMINSN